MGAEKLPFFVHLHDILAMKRVTFKSFVKISKKLLHLSAIDVIFNLVEKTI